MSSAPPKYAVLKSRRPPWVSALIGVNETYQMSFKMHISAASPLRLPVLRILV